MEEEFDSIQEMILDLKEGDAVEIECSGLKASFGTRPRQKSRERISYDENWEFQGEVVSVKDDRDRYFEDAREWIEVINFVDKAISEMVDQRSNKA